VPHDRAVTGKDMTSGGIGDKRIGIILIQMFILALPEYSNKKRWNKNTNTGHTSELGSMFSEWLRTILQRLGSSKTWWQTE